ncbi:MAG TPA: hypothetical protein VFA12_18480 [Stellaceae bacterium]|nr:hypothetical protein [Stellaceae bacterium]
MSNGAAERQRYEPAAVARLLVSTGNELVELLAAETQLLRASQTGEISALIERKTRLSNIFATGWRQFHGEPDALDEVSPELRRELLGIVRRLNDAVVENEEMLRIGRRAAELVLDAVGRALQAQRPRPVYTAERVACVPLHGQAGIGLNRSA